MKTKLTPKQERFVDEYLIDLNATQAAIRAGYAPKRADAIGSENLRKPVVAEAVRVAKLKRAQKAEVDSAWVLKRLVDQADADLADLFNQAGGLKPVQEWPEVWRTGLIAGVDVFEEFAPDGEGGRQVIGRTKKVRLSDRLKVLELIGKHVGVQAFSEKVDVTNKHEGPIQLDVGLLTSDAIRQVLAAAKNPAN